MMNLHIIRRCSWRSATFCFLTSSLKRRLKHRHTDNTAENNSVTELPAYQTSLSIQWVKKISPLRFSDNISPTTENFHINFTRLYVHIYAKLQNFIQSFPNLTKLCHINRDYRVNFYISLKKTLEKIHKMIVLNMA